MSQTVAKHTIHPQLPTISFTWRGSAVMFGLHKAPDDSLGNRAFSTMPPRCPTNRQGPQPKNLKIFRPSPKLLPCLRVRAWGTLLRSCPGRSPEVTTLVEKVSYVAVVNETTTRHCRFKLDLTFTYKSLVCLLVQGEKHVPFEFGCLGQVVPTQYSRPPAWWSFQSFCFQGSYANVVF